jgi:hypothetical protein
VIVSALADDDRLVVVELEVVDLVVDPRIALRDGEAIPGDAGVRCR